MCCASCHPGVYTRILLFSVQTEVVTMTNYTSEEAVEQQGIPTLA